MTIAATVVLLAGCAPSGGGADSPGEPGAITVEVAETDAGPSLVGPDGLTLYIFTEDSDGASTCVDDCAAAWPPFEVEAGATIEGGEGVTGDLGIIERDDGTSQATYKGMPLYFYAADEEPGDATGHGVGDAWYIASPEGQAGASPSEDAEPTEGGAEPTPYDYGY
jgi:predicted lipoprotein with Yx(FWY)xxD motif